MTDSLWLRRDFAVSLFRRVREFHSRSQTYFAKIHASQTIYIVCSVQFYLTTQLKQAYQSFDNWTLAYWRWPTRIFRNTRGATRVSRPDAKRAGRLMYHCRFYPVLDSPSVAIDRPSIGQGASHLKKRALHRPSVIRAEGEIWKMTKR